MVKSLSKRPFILPTLNPVSYTHLDVYKRQIIPVDSEHSAIFQIFEKQNFENITNITLTASGGAFRTFSLNQLASVTPEMATKHPNWKMGPKITVDSATLMNKGLELIEACRLFSLPAKKVEIVVHPESIIHGLVNYSDGTVLANLSYPCLLYTSRCV